LIVGILTGPIIAIMLAVLWDHYSGRYMAFMRGEVEEPNGWYPLVVAVCGALICAAAAVMMRGRELPRGVIHAALGGLAGAGVVVLGTLIIGQTVGAPSERSEGRYFVSIYVVPLAIVLGAIGGYAVGEMNSRENPVTADSQEAPTVASEGQPQVGDGSTQPPNLPSAGSP
jgi:hypothetical protein